MAKLETTLSAAQVKIAEALFAHTYAVTLGKRNGEPTSIAIPLADMPANAVLKIMAYGAQRTFNDAVGGSDKTLDAKVTEARELIARYVAGDIGRRAAEGVDALTAEIRKIMKAMVKAKVGAEAWKNEWAEADDLDERIDAVFAKQAEAFRKDTEAAAQAAIDERNARRAKLSGMGAGVEL